MKSFFIPAIILASVLAGCIPAIACTTALVSAGASETGRPMLWKQRDTGYEHSVLKHIRGAGFAFTAVFDAKDAECRFAYAGVNEKGFAIINNVSYNLSSNDLASQNGKIMRKALEQCETVADFMDMLQSLPVPRPVEANFGVADTSGQMAYIEAGDSTVTRFDVPENGWLVRSNFSISGRKEDGKGYARYETARALMESHKGKFASDFLFDTMARSFYNAVLGVDVSETCCQGMAVDLDFIPRMSTACDICIEVPLDNEPACSALIWCAIGYPLGCYAVPVWLAAADEMPSFVTKDSEGFAAANTLASGIRKRMHPLERDASGIYIDFNKALPMVKTVRRYEKTEYLEGLELDALFRSSGFDISKVAEYNRRAERRFERFSREINK